MSKSFKEIFDFISEKENHQFLLNEQYLNKTPFQIETPDGFKDIVSMIVKEDVSAVISTEKGDILASMGHKILTDSGLKYVKELSVGDVLVNKTGNIPILGITIDDLVLVYDITVDDENHLFNDANGFIHHNTYGITQGPRSLKALLGPEGGKWTYHSGVKASPLAFYKTLFEERDKIIVFDEADALLKNSEIVMMLKPILDTSGDNMAEYLTGTRNMVGQDANSIDKYSSLVGAAITNGATVTPNPSKTRKWDPIQTPDIKLLPDMGAYDVQLPSKFKFTGGMIFISNMRANQIEQAIMSRSIFIDVYLAERDVLKRIKTIGYAQAKTNPDISEKDVDEVLEALGASGSGKDEEITYMTPEYARKSKQVTVRAMQLALILKSAGLSRWKDLVALYA